MAALFKAMDEAGVEQSMIAGIPVAKKWHEDEPKRPRYYAGDDADAYWYSATDVYVAAAVQQLPPQQRRRLHPFLSGFNPVDKNAVSHIERMLELYPGLWQGIGEVFTRHDDLTALTSGDTPRANNEAMTRIYHLAAERDLPVLIHSNITSKRERNPLYLAEIEEPLRNHPHTRFIWAHAGTSAEIHRHQTQMNFLLPVLTRLLEDYPNLYIDLSWSMREPYLLDGQGKPHEAWVKLVERFPGVSCSVRMWSGAFPESASRCTVLMPSSMRCRSKWPTVWRTRIFCQCYRVHQNNACRLILAL